METFPPPRPNGEAFLAFPPPVEPVIDKGDFFDEEGFEVDPFVEPFVLLVPLLLVLPFPLEPLPPPPFRGCSL